MSKTLCKLSKVSETKRDWEKIQQALTFDDKPSFYCEKCLRLASKKKFLCKPERYENLLAQ